MDTGYYIIIGEDRYDGDSLISAKLKRSLALGELGCVPDTLKLKLHSSAFFAKETEIKLYTSNPYYSGFIESFYVKRISHAGTGILELDCVSALGLLETRLHYGGIYEGITFSALLADIIGSRFDYSVSSELASVPINGWLPIATRLQNLRQAMLAVGASVYSSDGKLSFAPLSTETAASIPDLRSFIGQRLISEPPVAAIHVTEHTFSPSGGEDVTLYSGEIPSVSVTAPSGTVRNGALVQFSSPMHSLTAVGTTILESGANYAFLAPSASCSLRGKYYSHLRRTVTRYNSAATSDSELSFKNFTLVSALNSDNVASRLSAYHGERSVLYGDFALGSESTGSCISPALEESTAGAFSGVITSLSSDFNTLGRCSAAITSYTDNTPAGNSFARLRRFTANESFTVPSKVSRIKVVMIGGGSGGTAGAAGADGSSAGSADGSEITAEVSSIFSVESGAGGKGGSAGRGGKGGKIYTLILDVEPGQSFSVKIGSGGAAGADSGAVGGASSFGSYSSESGESSSQGYYDTIQKIRYATSGSNGASGGDGGAAGTIDPIVKPEAGSSGGAGNAGGAAGANDYGIFDASGYIRAGGGGGGGGAYSASVTSSMRGSSGDVSESCTGSEAHAFLYGGNGGAGASASAVAAASCIGGGGNGGNGGGGGGGGGGVYIDPSLRELSITVQQITYRLGLGGSGGSGSSGTSGRAGCVLVYY